MTDPTPLSPAAQAVLKAACIHHGLFNEEVVQRRRSIAAALLALLQEKGAEIYDEDGRLVHFVVMQDDIRAIAAELEAQ